MKILLINPPCRIPVLIPLGLSYIASILRKKNHEIFLLDLNAENKTFDELQKVLANMDYDYIGIGGLTTTYSFVKRISTIIKAVKPDTKIVVGNMVSTASPEILLKNSLVDVCVIDEGENTIVELTEKIKDFPSVENIKGIVFRKGNSIITTPARKRIEDLDSLPFPSWDLFSMETYINNPIHFAYGRRSMNVSTVRGCPFQCIYCSRPFGRHVHMRSPGSVVSEIKELKKRYKIEFIGFTDDLFIVNKRWVMNVCDSLIKERLGIRWGSSARVNMVDSELLNKMKEAGCEALSYGFESGSQKMLDIMKKNVKIKDAERAIDLTRKAGITIEGSFMIGMAGETEETVWETVEFIKRTGLAMHRFFYATPFPDTPLYEMAKKMKKLPEDEDAYISSLGEMCNTLVVNLTDMTDEKLKKLKESAERKIKDNFGLKVKIEILNGELRRISDNFKKRLKTNGLPATLNWSLRKIRERIER